MSLKPSPWYIFVHNPAAVESILQEYSNCTSHSFITVGQVLLFTGFTTLRRGSSGGKMLRPSNLTRFRTSSVGSHLRATFVKINRYHYREQTENLDLHDLVLLDPFLQREREILFPVCKYRPCRDQKVICKVLVKVRIVCELGCPQ